MNAKTRRERIVKRLEQSLEPISATALANELAVSRQVIVGDIALLRAAGEPIAATPRGYVFRHDVSGVIRKVATRHKGDQTEAELKAYFPMEHWSDAHYWLIWHGRMVCTARKPKCDACPLAAICPTAGAQG